LSNDILIYVLEANIWKLLSLSIYPFHLKLTISVDGVHIRIYKILIEMITNHEFYFQNDVIKVNIHNLQNFLEQRFLFLFTSKKKKKKK